MASVRENAGRSSWLHGTLLLPEAIITANTNPSMMPAISIATKRLRCLSHRTSTARQSYGATTLVTSLVRVAVRIICFSPGGL